MFGLLLVASAVIAALIARGGNECEIDEDNIINAAILYKMREADPQKGRHWSASGEEFTVSFPFDSPEGLRIEFPDCCRFSFRGPDGWLPTWYRRYKTDYAGMVHFDWIENHHYFDREEHIKRQFEIPMSSCAEPIPPSAIYAGRFEY